MRISGKLVIVGLLLIVVLTVGVTWVFAHGGDPDLIHACVNQDSGGIRIVGPNDACKSKESALDWPAYDPEVPPAPPGVLGFYTRYNPGVDCSDGVNCVAVAVCDSGDAVTGGGFVRDATPGNPDVSIVESRPTAEYIWQVVLANYSGGSVFFRAYARCADMTP